MEQTAKMMEMTTVVNVTLTVLTMLETKDGGAGGRRAR